MGGVDTGGLDGGYKVAQNINEVITKNMQSGDTVVLGGDFNAHSYGSTVKALRYNFGYNLRASSRIVTKGNNKWMQLDHVFTKNGQGLDAAPEIKEIHYWDTGADHDGLKLTWSNGLSGGNGPAPNPSPAPAPGPAPANCGHTPSSCNSDLNWAANSGKYSHPEYYPNFKSVTGVELRSASWDDMVTYFACTHQNPRNNCGGITVPCDRSCGKSGMAMFTDLFGAIEYHDVHHVLLVLCSLLVTLSWTLCIINLCVSMRQRRKASYAMVKQVDSEHEI